ncbi:GDP-D-glucose phosphorylase 1 [Taenia solium]|eukprot:TsM_001015900 transcript=TsM_001015900 gene=TsM_001015900
MAAVRRSVYSFDNLIWAITGRESEILMNRFTNRREPFSFRAVDEPCPVNEFNFTKVKSSEKLFQISFQELGNCCGLVVANASPFMVGHSLIVPNPEELLNQLALQTILLSADTRLWALVERCQEMRIAHNLFAARNITGALRVVLWLRRSVYGSKTYHRRPTSRDQWTLNVAVTELAGMFVVPDEAAARPLSLPGGLCEIYIDERLSRQEIAQLEASLISSVT